MSVAFRELTSSVTILVGSTSWFNTTTTPLPANRFKLNNALVNPTSGGRASGLTLTIEDNNKTLFSTLTIGSTVYCAVGRASSTLLTVFGGIIEEHRHDQITKSTAILTLECTGWEVKLMHKVVKFYERSIKRSEKTGKIDLDDAKNMIVTDIIVTIMNSTDPTVYHEGNNSKVSAALSTGGGLIQPFGIYVPDVKFEYKYLHDVLRELFDYLRYTWGVTPDAKLYGRHDELAPHSGVTLDSSTTLEHSVSEDVYDTYGTIFVIGSDEFKQGNNAITTETNSFRNTSSVYLAQKFVAEGDLLKTVLFRVTKVGSPQNLTVGVYNDQVNTPKGAISAIGSFDRDKASNSPEWHKVDFDLKISAGASYWFVLFRSAEQASATTNHWRWHTDETGGATTATSSDNVSWTVSSNTSNYAFAPFYANPVIYPADAPSVRTVLQDREIVWNQPEINNFEMGVTYGKMLQKALSKKRRVIKATVITPVEVLQPGQLVTYSTAILNSTTYLITDVNYSISDVSSWEIGITMSKFVDV